MAIINGTPGNDTLTSFGVGDTLIGGAGDDLYIVNDPTDVVTEPTNAGVLIRLSVGSSAVEADNSSINPLFSADGSKVVFSSSATNLDGGDTNGKQDIFVTDLTGSTVSLVSRDVNGVVGNGDSRSASFSADGSKVIFSSQSTNLISADSNALQDIFVKDLTTGVVTLVSTSSAGAQANGVSDLGTLSADGSKVLFVSSASNLVAGDTNGKQDVFVKDLNTGVTTRISTDGSNGQDNGASFTPQFSADGTQVVFASEATNLTVGDTNGAADIFVKNLTTGAITLISTDSSNAQGNSSSQTPVFSPDGTKVAFVSYSRLSSSDNNGTSDIYIKDLSTGAVTLVTTDALGVQANGFSGSPAFSADGTKLTFISYASNLVAGADNSVGHVFVKDLLTGAVTLVSADEHDIQGNNTSLSASINPDGSQVVFSTTANNLLVDDNGVADIYIKSLTGGGNDTVESSSSYTLNAHVEDLTLTGSGNTNGTGNDLWNVIKGNAGNNILDGGSGKDTMQGGAGNDTYYVDDVGDVVQETNDGSVTLFSTDSSGVTGNASSDQPVVPTNGNNIVFISLATNLAANATNGSQHIYSKDYTTGVVTLVSSSASGVQGDAYSFAPSVSADGTKVAFSSTSDNLVTGDSNAFNDIFVKNLSTGGVTLASSTAAGVQGNDQSGSASISADGTKVAFVSYATNLVSGDSNGERDIFVKDLTTGSLTLVSRDSSGTIGNGFSEMPSISPDGSKVVFASSASNLVAGDTNGQEDIFLKDLTTGAVTLLSSDINGVQGIRDSNTPIFSPDGSKVAFLSSSGNLVIDSSNGYQKLFIKDLTTGAVTFVSVAADGTQPDGYVFAPSFSADGTKMAFASFADNLVPGDTNGTADVFVKDLITGALTRVSSDIDGVIGNALSAYTAFTPDGKVIFSSDATNLLAPDVNAARDLYVKDLNTDTGGVDTVHALINYTLGANVENLVLESNAVNGTGNDLNNVLTGNGENNILSGGIGADTLDGGTGADTLIGGVGNDVYLVNSGTPVIQESALGGTDTVQASVTHYLAANVENLTLVGVSAINAIGNSLDNVLTGNSGDNVLNGNSGNDTLIGGLGNDLYVIDSISDVITENALGGTDSVRASFSDTLGANLENLILTGTRAINATGNALDNVLTGNSAANTLNGGLGSDTLNGGKGSDLYIVDNAGDVVREAVNSGVDTVSSSINYTLTDNVEKLILTGGSNLSATGNDLANTLTGNSADNSLVGRVGNDTLDGGLGNDILIGGAGNDVFAFSSTLNAATNTDKVVDFSSGDKLALSQLIFSQAGPVGTLSSSLFVAGAGLTTGQDADDRVVYNTTTGNLYYDADGSGAGASILFAQLGTSVHPTLTAAVIQVV